MAILSIWAAGQANVNPGIICVMWLVNPVLMSLGDLILFKQKLKVFHFVGIMFIIICGLLISLGKTDENLEVSEQANLPVWAAVLISSLTGFYFTAYSLFTKHLC